MLTFGVVGEPATLDPYSPNASDLSYALVRPLYPSLFRMLPSGEARPSLALSMAESREGVRVRLRRARWSDGRAITAADVVASIRRARPPSGFAEVTRAEELGSRTLGLEGRVRNWPETLARAAFVMPRSDDRRVSGGPFRIAARRPGLRIVYEPNPEFWGPSARLGRVEVQFIESTEVMMGLLRKHRLDAAAPPSTLNLGGRLADAGLRSDSALGWEGIYLDFTRSDLSRAERVFVARALDREGLASLFVFSGGRLSNALHPAPGPRGADGHWSRGLGADARPFQTIEIAAARDDELISLLHEAIYEQLTSAGVDVELTAIEGSELYGGWLPDNPVDAVLRRAAGGPGLSSGAAAFEAFDALPLVQVESWLAWEPPVRGPEPNPTFEGPLWNLERWWVEGR